jgi:hypothetical protein
MTQNREAPFTMNIGVNGELLFNDKNHNWNGELSYEGSRDFQYRLTKQNDGNIMLY